LADNGAYAVKLSMTISAELKSVLHEPPKEGDMEKTVCIRCVGYNPSSPYHDKPACLGRTCHSWKAGCTCPECQQLDLLVKAALEQGLPLPQFAQ
jgi:hypothetical protein